MPRAGVFLVEYLFYVFIDVFYQKQPALASVVCDIPAVSLHKAYFSRGRISRVRCTAVMFEATCVIIYTQSGRLKLFEHLNLLSMYLPFGILDAGAIALISSNFNIDTSLKDGERPKFGT